MSGLLILELRINENSRCENKRRPYNEVVTSTLICHRNEVRMATVWPLAWMRHERTPGILRRAYLLEQDSGVKAHIVRVSASLMSEAGDGLLQDALKSKDDVVRGVAEQISADRARAATVATFDESAADGVKIATPAREATTTQRE